MVWGSPYGESATTRIASAQWRWWGLTPELVAVEGLHGAGTVRRVVPLWLAAGALLGASGACAWQARRARLRGVGRCAACGYDLRGLAPAAACPECGGGTAP